MMKEGARGTGARSRFRVALVAAQVAAALILLAGAGLPMRSSYEIKRVDAGFQPDHLTTMRRAPALYKFRDRNDLQIQLARGIPRKVSALPSVRAAAISTDIPSLGNSIYMARLEGRPPAITVLARTTQEPATIGAAIKAAILNTDRLQPVFAMQPMTEVAPQSIALRRLELALLAFFAASALFLTALGLYGAMSHDAALRTSGIGIRMALGAQQSQVLLFIERQGLMLTLAGVAIGFVGALG
jgi:hypothetical protein